MLTINIQQKKFADKVILQNINLSILHNGIYGIVGKNGQGKTTFFKCVMGLEKYEGASFINDTKIELANVAWCPSEPTIYEELTAKEFYEFYRCLLNLEKTDDQFLFDVPENKLIREFSTGMKKKVFLNSIFQKKLSDIFFR